MLPRLRTAVTTGLGIILTLVPPALWVAWTERVLLIVCVAGIVSAALLVVLSETEGSITQASSGPGAREVLSDEAVADIHSIFPLTYHHSRVRSARFHDIMDKVRDRDMARPTD